MGMLDNVPYSAFDGIERPILVEHLDAGVVTIDLEQPNGVFFVPLESAGLLLKLLKPTSHPSAYNFIDRRNSLKSLGIYEAPKQRNRTLSAWVHVVNSCNLSCSYCYIPKLNKAVTVPKTGSMMSEAVAHSMVVGMFETAREKNFDQVHFRFAGGEPSLALDRLHQVCDHALKLSSEFGIRTQFNALSNGVDLSEEFISFARSYNFSLSFSVDGFEEDHDKTRFQIAVREGRNARQSTWDKVLSSFDRCRGVGIPVFALTTVTKHNINHLDQMVRLLVKKDIGFRLSLVRDKMTALDSATQEIFSQKLISIYKELPEILPLNRPIPSRANFAEWNPSFGKKTTCGTCHNSFAVSETGSVATCQMRFDRSFGFVQDNSLDTILSSMTASSSAWRFSRPDEATGGCTRCLFRLVCAGGCPEHTQLAANTYDRPSPWCRVYGDLLPHYVRAIGRQIERAWSARQRSRQNKN